MKRDADLALQKIPPQYEEKSQQWYDKYEVIPPIQHKRQLKIQDIQSVKNIEKVPGIVKSKIYSYSVIV